MEEPEDRLSVDNYDKGDAYDKLIDLKFTDKKKIVRKQGPPLQQ